MKSSSIGPKISSFFPKFSKKDTNSFSMQTERKSEISPSFINKKETEISMTKKNNTFESNIIRKPYAYNFSKILYLIS